MFPLKTGRQSGNSLKTLASQKIARKLNAVSGNSARCQIAPDPEQVTAEVVKPLQKTKTFYYLYRRQHPMTNHPGDRPTISPYRICAPFVSSDYKQ
jgi:hypothetical protein